MSLSLKRALDRAAVWHHGQLRKYPGVEVPYMSHVAGVAAILSRHGFDEAVVVAGALHDVIEDCGITSEQIEAAFGADVASLVRDASERDRTAGWEQRKQAYVDAFPLKPWRAQAVTLADKIDNFESIVVCAADFGDPWRMFKRGKQAQLERFDALAARFGGLPKHPIVDEFLEALERVRALPG